MAIPLFFNNEIGFVDREEGIQALLKAASAYQSLHKHFAGMTSHKGMGGELRLFRENEIEYRLKDCLPFLEKTDKEKVCLLLSSLSKGLIIDETAFAECENWIVFEIGIPSPFMEYAARNTGILLSVATAECWKQHFFTFQENDRKLPNLWGQDDLSQLTAWIHDQQTKIGSYLAILKDQFNCRFCFSTLSNTMLDSTEWKVVLELFRRSQKQNYEPTPSGYPTKGLSGFATKYGAMVELRHQSSGLRIFLVATQNGPFVGGIYKKGMGVSQHDAINRAHIRINTYTW